MSETAATPTTTFSGGARAFNALVGVTTLGIFLQAVTAGEFVSQEHRGGWIAAHNIIGNATLVVALVTAIIGFVAIRRSTPAAAWASVVLFVLLVVQIVIGHLITDGKQDGWIGVHVPLAFVIFGITIWLSVRGAVSRRALTRRTRTTSVE
jgi:uncharacterized membrane protein YtjA (UPF0391 family)